MRLTRGFSDGVRYREVVARALAFILVLSMWGRAAADQVEDLARTAQGDRSEKARIAAVVALGKLADPRGEPALVRALDDPSPVVRDVAASALRHLRDVRSRPPRRPPAPETVPTRASITPREPPRRLHVIVKHMAGPERQLSTRMHDLVVQQLAAENVTIDDSGGPNGFIVDGSITKLSRGTTRGPWVEVTCEVKLTVSNSQGSLLSIVSGGATVQTARGAYRQTMDAELQAEALDNAVRGAHQNLLTFLVRQAGVR
jgi:hypothetical protein